MKNITTFGQVFTPKEIVSFMISLKRNQGTTLEPSCGDGAFSNEIENCVAIEIDETKCPEYAFNIDFFKYSVNEKFDTIIGNPPYVKFQNISKSTKNLLDMSLFDKRSNLYLFFIYKCILHLKPHGELIFIVPREFLKATSSILLNEFIYKNGTITDIIDLGDKTIFNGYCPNVVIFRFEKDNLSRRTSQDKTFACINGQLLFINEGYTVPFNKLFFVKVGGVSGADGIFTNINGNMDFVCSKTVSTGKTRKMFYNTEAPELLKYKDELLNRKIKKIDNSNWYMWGRNFYASDSERIYVNMKTRINKPFFIHECKNYDGSILAIFPKIKLDLNEAVKMLNEVNWEELGFRCGGRYMFTQKALENSILPKEFEKFL